MPSHTVRQGEHLSRVAQQYGFRDYRLIWDDRQNADLKKKRGNPNVLLPGDVLHIPEKRQNRIAASSENGIRRIPSLEMELPVKIGHLDPPDEDTGWRQRLINLGYHAKGLDDKDETKLRHSVEEFQCDHGLKVPESRTTLRKSS